MSPASVVQVSVFKLCHSKFVPRLLQSTSYKLSTRVSDAEVFEVDGVSGKAADNFSDEASVILNMPTGCNETQNHDVMQLCPSVQLHQVSRHQKTGGKHENVGDMMPP